MENKFVDIFYKVGYECLRLYDDPQQRPGQIIYPDERRLWMVDNYTCHMYHRETMYHPDQKALIFARDKSEAILLFDFVKKENLKWKIIFVNDHEAHGGYFLNQTSEESTREKAPA